jgi:hypothetical protein
MIIMDFVTGLPRSYKGLQFDMGDCRQVNKINPFLASQDYLWICKVDEIVH